MSFRVNAKALLEALAGGVYGRGSDMPVLRHALLRAEEDGRMAVFSTDLQTQVVEMIEADGIPEAFEALVDAEKLKAALFAREGEAELEASGEALLVKFGGRRAFHVPTLPAAMFASFEKATRVVMEGADVTAIGAAIGRVAYAAPDNDARPALNGVTLTGISAAASNGHRLAIAYFPECFELNRKIIIPRHAVKVVADAMVMEGAEIALLKIGSDPIAIEVSNDWRIVTVRLLAVPAYDFERAIPLGSPVSVITVDNARSLEAPVARVARFSSGSLASVRVAGKGRDIEISVDGASDEAEAEISQEFEMGISSVYLADVLKASGGKVRWECYGAKNASIFKPDGRNDLHIVMPSVL